MIKTILKSAAMVALTGVALGDPESPPPATAAANREARREKLDRMRHELAEQMASVEAEMALAGDEQPLSFSGEQQTIAPAGPGIVADGGSIPKALGDADVNPVELKESSEIAAAFSGADGTDEPADDAASATESELDRLRKKVAALEAAAATKPGQSEPEPQLKPVQMLDRAAATAEASSLSELALDVAKPPNSADAGTEPAPADGDNSKADSEAAPVEPRQAFSADIQPAVQIKDINTTVVVSRQSSAPDGAREAQTTQDVSDEAASPADTAASKPEATAAESVPAPSKIITVIEPPASSSEQAGPEPEEVPDLPVPPVIPAVLSVPPVIPATLQVRPVKSAATPEAPPAALLQSGGAKSSAVGYDQADPVATRAQKLRELRSLRTAGGGKDKDRRSKRRAANLRARALRESLQEGNPAGPKQSAEQQPPVAVAVHVADTTDDGVRSAPKPVAADPSRAAEVDATVGYGTMFSFGALIIGLFGVAGYVVKHNIIPGAKRRDSFAACSTQSSSTNVLSSFGTSSVYNRKCGRASFGV